MTSPLLPLLSFNCVICFDQFNDDDRPPVVLPCGHTYVCAVCASRLDKCMECRISLFATNPTTAASVRGAAAAMASARSNFSTRGSPMAASRTAHRRFPPVGYQRHSDGSMTLSAAKPPAEPKKTRLPLPKNTVLLYLMDAHTRASQSAEKLSQEKCPPKKQNILVKDSSKEGGTYAVLVPAGLTILPRRKNMPNPSPNCEMTESSCIEGEIQVEESFETELKLPAHSREPPVWHSSSDFIQSIEEDVSSIIENFRASQKLDEPTKSGENGGAPADFDGKILKCGDRIQVVSIQDGWAKLARGYGYVHCPIGTEIIKISDYADSACKLEAMLYSLAFRSDELLREQNNIMLTFNSIKEDLQDSLDRSADLTVVSGIASTTDKFQGMETGIAADTSLSDSSSDGGSIEESEGNYNTDTTCTASMDPKMEHQDLDDTSHAIQAAGLDNTQGLDWLMCFVRQGSLDLATTGTSGVGGNVEATMNAGRMLQDIYPTSSMVPTPPRGSAKASDSTAASTAVDFKTGLSSPRPRKADPRKPTGQSRLLRMSSHSALTMSRGVKKIRRRSSQVRSSLANREGG